MKIEDFKYSPYHIEFKKPIKTGKTEHTGKKGFIIELTDDKGIKGSGDSSPLPEFGSESYEDVEDSFEKIRKDFPKFSLNDDLNSIDIFLDFLENLPTVRHAIEQALIEILIKRQNLSLDYIFNRNFSNTVEINGLVGILPPGETAGKVSELISKGYKTIKLKAGSDNFDNDYVRIKAAVKASGSRGKLRIDINGNWSFDEAVENLKRLNEFKLEFVEQPVSDSSQLLRLADISPTPIAADESIRNFNSAVKLLDKSSPLNFLVIKPMLIGGILNTLKLIALAERKERKVIISSSFESDTGRKALLLCAAAANNDLAHGLGVTDNYKNHQTKMPVRNGTVEFNSEKTIINHKANFIFQND